jgi:polysaccharide biosynthesis transport protein
MTESNGRETATLQDYAAVLRRRKWIVLTVVVVLPLMAVLLSLNEQQQYRASTNVLIGIGEVPQGSNQRVAPDRVLQTAAHMARAPEVAAATVDAGGGRAEQPAGFLARSSVRANRDSDLLVFQVEDPDGARAMRLAVVYAEQFIAYRRRLDGGRYSRQAGPAFLVASPVKALKVDPNPMRNGALALGLAVILGVILAFLADAVSARVASTEELRVRLGMPLLGRLAGPSRRLKRRNELVMLAEPGGHQAEAFRSFRTNLEFFNLERGARRIMLTSAIEDEGKSTTVANLAVALARQGRRVILVDLDLRHATLHRFFDLVREPGVTDVVLGSASLDEALSPVHIAAEGPGDLRWNGGGAAVEGTLHVLAAGSAPPNIGEFCTSAALAGVLSSLGDRADLVLVDGPPLLGAGDAASLSAHVDAMVLVARLNLLRRPVLDEARRVLDLCRAGRLGFVATGARPSESYTQKIWPQGGGFLRRELDRVRSVHR